MVAERRTKMEMEMEMDWIGFSVEFSIEFYLFRFSSWLRSPPTSSHLTGFHSFLIPTLTSPTSCRNRHETMKKKECKIFCFQN